MITKPTVEQVAWMLRKVKEAIETGPSFRKFIYGILGFTQEDYAVLYLAGGMDFTNFLSEAECLRATLQAIENSEGKTSDELRTMARDGLWEAS